MGNDFIAIINPNSKLNLSSLARKFCKRKFSIGADGLIAIYPDELTVKFYNADGSAAELCANGLIVSGILLKEILKLNNNLKIKVQDSEYRIFINNKNVSVNLGLPTFDKNSIGFTGKEDNTNFFISFNSLNFKATSLSLKNPHLILILENILKLNDLFIAETGRYFSIHPYFKNGVNVGFAYPVSKNEIKLRTYERGVGETLACGTNASATAYALNHHGYTDKKVKVKVPGGCFEITIDKKLGIFLKGRGKIVYRGEVKT